MKSLLAPGSWIICHWQEADEQSFAVVQLETWTIFLITGQEYVSLAVRTNTWVQKWSLTSGASGDEEESGLSLVQFYSSVSPSLGQWWFGPPGPHYRMAGQPKCLQPLTFRVEGVGMPPGSTTDQSGLHNFPGSAGGRHGDGCTKSVVPCAFLSVGVCLALCWWLKRGERPPCPAQQPLSASPLCLYVCLCANLSNKGSAGAWGRSRHWALPCRNHIKEVSRVLYSHVLVPHSCRICEMR